MSIKIGFLHYMKRTRVMLPIMFKEFKVVYIFLLFFCLTIIVNWWIVNFSKNLGGGGDRSTPQPPRFLRVCIIPIPFCYLNFKYFPALICLNWSRWLTIWRDGKVMIHHSVRYLQKFSNWILQQINQRGINYQNTSVY